MSKLAPAAVALFAFTFTACTQTDIQPVEPPIEDVADDSPAAVDAIAVQADWLTEGVEVDQCDMWASDVCAKAKACGSGDIADESGVIHQGAADCYAGVKARCAEGAGLCLDGACSNDGRFVLAFECSLEW